MFTGIIEATATVESAVDLGGGIAFMLATPLADELEVDDSIAVNGVCLTVVEKGPAAFHVQAVEETLRKTTLGTWRTGTVVNVERAMKMGARLDGHIVQGHVDTIGRVIAIEAEATGRLVHISYPVEFADYIIGRGSVAVDGISLTVAREERDRFTVAIIPYTWDHTTMGRLNVGDAVNIEFDLVGKYVLRHLKNRAEGQPR